MSKNSSKRGLSAAIGLGALGVLSGMYGFSQLSGKATPEEQAWRYPGDDLIDANYDNGYSSTYAITIEAPLTQCGDYSNKSARKRVVHFLQNS